MLVASWLAYVIEGSGITSMVFSALAIPALIPVQSLWKFINGRQHNFDVSLVFACRRSLLTNYNSSSSSSRLREIPRISYCEGDCRWNYFSRS
ncbi:hypothetical protein M5689_005786 [Euphorbia peplus]|nr:hypothetical protein M5689_005786 [Euphorbia peplus]